jgi:hypothetical protein
MMQPLSASSAKTVPFWLPTNKRLPTTVGCAQADVASGNPNAHLSVTFGRSSAESPATSRETTCVFSRVGPQPFHCGFVPGAKAVVLLQRPALGSRVVDPGVLPVMCSATARRSAPLNCRP